MPEVIDQATGGADEYVDALAQRVTLLLIAGTAVDQPQPEICIFAQQPGIAVNLDRKFARRCQYYRTDAGRLVLFVARARQ